MEKEQPAPPADANARITSLLGQPAVLARQRSGVASRRRQPTNTYDRVTRIIGLAVALLLMAALWFTGGYFTLQWLASVGLRIADAGLAPIVWLLRLPGPTSDEHWLWAVAVWSLPAAISAAEIGLWPRRVAHPLLWIIWAAFLGFDALTTAAGVVLVITADPLTAWLVGLTVGVALALFPEKAARVIWRLLREG